MKAENKDGKKTKYLACFLNASKRNNNKTISAVIGVSELHEVKVKKNGKEIYLRKILLHAARAGKSVNKRQAYVAHLVQVSSV